MLISDLSFCSRFHFDCCQPPTTFAQHGFNCPRTSFSLVVVSYGAIFSGRDILPPGQSSPTLDSFTHTQSRASSLARPSRLPRQRGQSAPQSPTINSPILDNTLFTDTDAFRLYFQYHESITELTRITLRLKRASKLLQFVPGPPGHQGSYRINPSVPFPPDTTDFLAEELHIVHPPRNHHPQPRRQRQLLPSRTTARDRSRSRDTSIS